MFLQINTRYRLKSTLNTHLTVGTLKVYKGVKYWCIVCNDGANYEAPFAFYTASCKW